MNDRAPVLETTSWEADHHLIEIVVAGAERDHYADPVQLEEGLSRRFRTVAQ